MSDVTQILGQIEDGDPSAAEKLLPLVYEELRKLAAARMADERSDHTLQATALVHEAYMRLVDVEKVQKWDSRGHFFAAAAEAMRRILVEKARFKSRQKHGGEIARIDNDVHDLIAPSSPGEVLAVHDALDALESINEPAARLVKLRYFAGMTIPDAAEALAISPRKADQLWSYARAWLLAEIHAD
ncbi:MAG TPA: ECF-type sigma factor [Planctomycetaceae bacterium]|nr:ECF-type sigma factor [Planctomycetaceae bacterium]